MRAPNTHSVKKHSILQFTRTLFRGISTMSSRRSATRNLPVQHSNATESMEQKLKRLRPDLQYGSNTHNDWQWQRGDWQGQSTWHEHHAWQSSNWQSYGPCPANHHQRRHTGQEGRAAGTAPHTRHHCGRFTGIAQQRC